MPAIGATFGPYRIVAPLGAGGMGEVYRAHDPRLRRDVALKVLPAQQAGEAEAIARMMRESRVVAALNHPGIVTIHDVGEESGSFYHVTELIEGETLRARLSREALPVRQALDIAVAIGNALAAAHSRGIVHRDLKPENVMVTRTGEVKVLDFGVARTVALPDAATVAGLTRLTATGAVIGTAAYMAPEQLAGCAIDHRTDQFALGVMLFEMITGERPFKGTTGADLAASILRDEPPPLRAKSGDLPAPVTRIVARCLAKNPDDRYASTTGLAHALADVRADFDVLITAPPRRRPVRSFSIATVAVLTVVIVALGGVALWVWPRFNSASSVITHSSLRTIAVLPFASIGEVEPYLADGISEAVARELGKVDGMRVIAAASASRYRDRVGSLKEVGRELGADLVVRGSVQRTTDRVRISASLLSASDDAILWTNHYDRALTDILAIQDDIAWQVAAKMAAALGANAPPRPPDRPMTSAAAYDQYLQGVHILRGRSIGYGGAVVALERAVSLDPNFALAHARLAGAYTQVFFYVDNDPSIEAKATNAIAKALALNPDLAEAYLARAQLIWNLRNGFPHERAIADLRRALENNPNLADAHIEIGKLYYHIGLLDKARAANEEARRLDPFSRVAIARLVVIDVDAGNRDGLADGLLRNSHWSWTSRVNALAYLRRNDEAIAVIAEQDMKTADLVEQEPTVVAQSAQLLARVGRRAEAERMLGVAIPGAANPTGLSDTHHAQFYIGCTYALLGDREKALEWITKAANEGYPSYPRFSTEPDLASLKGQVNFEALLERLRKDHARWSKTL